MIASRLAMVVVAVALMGALWSSGVSKDVGGSAAIAAGGVTTLATAIGNISVTTWASKDVRWIAHEHAGNRQDLDRLSVDVTKDAGNVTLKAIPFDRCDNCGIDLEVWVPRMVSVAASGATGNISLKGIANTVIARTATGNVDVSASDGDVLAETQTGSVNAILSSLRGTHRITLSTATGSITLGLPRSAGATISASTDIGNISSAFGSPQRQMLSATLQTNVGNGSIQVRLSSHTGSITLRAL